VVDQKGGRRMIRIFDLVNMEPEAYEQREKNVFFQNDLFKTRVIDLKPEQRIPDCQMDSFVMFYVVRGEVLLKKDDESATLKENQVFISEPALLSMETRTGAKLMGVEIKTRE
jgi:mannose-6-phosphate isomerase class I